MNTTLPDNENPAPMVANYKKLELLAPLAWLAKGWKDFTNAPVYSICYGLCFMLVSQLIFIIAWQYESIVLAISLLSAFIFVAPILCIGLYSISRQAKRKKPIDMLKSLRHGYRPYKDLLMFIVVVTVIALIWARSASMIHIFMPSTSSSSASDLLLFLSVGSVVGSLFSLLIFTISVFSIPMVMDKDVDMITCILSSINAVLHNKTTMMFWAMVVVIMTAIGMLSVFIGFTIIMPVLGYATWHGYRETIDASYWPDRINEFKKL